MLYQCSVVLSCFALRHLVFSGPRIVCIIDSHGSHPINYKELEMCVQLRNNRKYDMNETQVVRT